MNRCVIAVIALSLCVLPLRAQEAKEATERTEDIEVLRRILNKSLGLTLQPSPVMSFGNVGSGIGRLGEPLKTYGTQDLMIEPQIREVYAKPFIAPFDGIYLKGHGVVYTLKIPAGAPSTLVMGKEFGLSETCVKCHSLDVVPKAAVDAGLDFVAGNKQFVEWLQTQNELRGKKPIDAALATDVAICEPGKLAARLTDKLYNNCNNVRHVPVAEKFTVVVTYESYTGSAQHHVTTTAAEVRNSTAAVIQGGVHLGEAQQIRLGDLHLKNKKYSDAIQAYREGLKRLTKPKVVVDLEAAGRGMTPEQNAVYEQKIQKMLSAAFLSLADACLKLKLDEAWATYHKDAHKEIDTLLVFATEMSQRLTITVQIGASATTGIAVPAKLILSFKLSDVRGEIDNFRKDVKVETIGFPPADPKPTPAKK